MDYEALGNSALFWGSVWVGVGAIIVSAGWFFLGFHKQTSEWLAKRRRLRAATPRRTVIVLLVAILLGSILIARGGTLTTKGCNLLNKHEEKQALIQAVANEWITNEFTLPCRNLPFDPNSEELGKIHYIYPTFRSSGLDTFLTSSLFSLDNAVDRQLLLQVMRYEPHISDFNYLLRRIDDECTITGVSQEQRRNKYRAVSESPLFQNYCDSHRATGQLLRENYSWALSERVGKYLEPLKERSTRPIQKAEHDK